MRRWWTPGKHVGLHAPTWLLSAKSMWPLAGFRAVANRRRNATGQELRASDALLHADSVMESNELFFLNC